MDEAIIKYYRRLLKTNFEHAGSLENPSIYIETEGQNLPICGGIGEYLHLYIDVKKDNVSDIKYLCICNPAANVAVEILCSLAKGKSLVEVLQLSGDSFYNALGSRSEEFQGKVNSLLEIVRAGINKRVAEKI